MNTHQQQERMLNMVMMMMMMVLLFLFVVVGECKSTIEPCEGSDTCSSLVGYTLPTDLKISELATRFQIDPLSLLGANGIDLSIPDVQNQILPSRSFLRVPLTCGCVDGIRKAKAVAYKVRASDTVTSIAESVFGGLVTPGQVKDANDLTDSDPLDMGQSLDIPLPCSCFNGSDNGLPSVFLSYVVKGGDSMGSLAAKYGTTVTDLSTVNALGQPSIKPGDIISIPLAACASGVSKYSADAGLLVANGSYAITAGHCVMCMCGPRNMNMYCAPAPLAASCSSMQCRNSNLMLGNVTTQPTAAGCNVTTCSYNGFINGTILTSLQISLQPQCPAAFVMPNFTRPSEIVMAPAPSPSLSPFSRNSTIHVMPPGASIFPGFGPASGPAGTFSFASIQKARNPYTFSIIFIVLLVILGS